MAHGVAGPTIVLLVVEAPAAGGAATVQATCAGAWGGATGAVTADVTHEATPVAGSWGGWAGVAAASIVGAPVAAGAWGGLSGTATAVKTVNATAAGSWGAMSGAATAVKTIEAPAVGTWGGWLGSAITLPFVVDTLGRNLVDPSGLPMLVLADSPWSLCVRLSTTQMDSYFANREAHGFNAVGVYLICGNTTAGFDSSGSTYDSIVPFTSGNMATPNSTYWARIDTMFSLAEQYNITVFAFPAEHQHWGSFVVSSGSTKCTNYGAFLGNRYKTRPNIVWMFGDDYTDDGSWASEDPRYLDILSGIRSTGDTHIDGVQLHYIEDDSYANPTWDSHIDFATVYTYEPPLSHMLDAYHDAQALPTVFIEGGYELETLQTNTGTRNQIRRVAAWVYLGGGVGNFYGHRDIWQMNGSYTSALTTASATDLLNIITKLKTLDFANWVPDEGTTFITSGRGSDTGTNPTSNTWCGCARTSNLAVLYMPTSRSFTLNTAVLTGTVSGYWFDPTDAHTVTYTTATHPGNNSAGDADWFLILESGNVSATGAGSWGGLTGVASAVVVHEAVAAGSWGALTGTSTPVKTVVTTAAGTWGAMSGTATAFRIFEAVATGAWGALAGAATAVATDESILAGSWGALTGTANAVTTHEATAAGTWGALSGSATAFRTFDVSASGSWGSLGGSIAAEIIHPAVADGQWGGWTGTALVLFAGQVIATGAWGAMSGLMAADVSHDVSTASGTWGALSGAAIATRQADAVATGVWGSLSGTAIASKTVEATAAGVWGQLAGQVLGDGAIAAVASGTWGSLEGVAIATVIPPTQAVGAGDWGTLSGTAVATAQTPAVVEAIATALWGQLIGTAHADQGFHSAEGHTLKFRTPLVRVAWAD